ncbi:MAG: hypothetical protein AAF702_43330 [Chloroflexota bacterium]
MSEYLPLQPGHLYAVDGGIFICKQDEESGVFSLSTYLGKEGHVVLRVGFEVREDGRLLDRIYDYEADQVEVVDFRGLSIGDLRKVSRSEVLEENSPLWEGFRRLMGEVHSKGAERSNS